MLVVLVDRMSLATSVPLYSPSSHYFTMIHGMLSFGARHTTPSLPLFLAIVRTISVPPTLFDASCGSGVSHYSILTLSSRYCHNYLTTLMPVVAQGSCVLSRVLETCMRAPDSCRQHAFVYLTRGALL